MTAPLTPEHRAVLDGLSEDTPSIAAIVEGLSEAQRDIVLHGFSARHRFASMNALVRKGLFAQRTCFPDGNGFPRTPLGEAVRTALQEQSK